MSQKLQVKAFFFNAKTDYLPYHKHFTLNLADDAVAKDILIAISKQNWDFSYPELNLVFKINNLVIEEDTFVSNIVEKLGTELTIDPVNSYRSTNGLIINNDDFMKSFELLAPFTSDTDKAYYKTLYALHYASETENFNREYIGDAVLVLAYKMIKEGNENKEEILTAITSVTSGLLDCEYENNLFYEQDYTTNIDELKAMISGDDEVHASFFERIKSTFFPHKENKVKEEHKTVKNLDKKQIAYYPAVCNEKKNVISQMIRDMGTKEITFQRAHKLSGLGILENSKTLALKKAGTTLLNAFDAGAEVLIVENTDLLDMFSKHYTNIEKILGRKIIGLELLSSEDFITQVSSIEY